MSYTLRPDLTLPQTLAGRTLVELDGGDLVALAVETWREPGASTLVIEATAVAVDGDLAPIADSDGYVDATHRHSCSPDVVALFGEAALRRSVARLVLGEPPEPGDFEFSDAVRQQASIRNQILLATASAGSSVPLDSIL